MHFNLLKHIIIHLSERHNKYLSNRIHYKFFPIKQMRKKNYIEKRNNDIFTLLVK